MVESLRKICCFRDIVKEDRFLMLSYNLVKEIMDCWVKFFYDLVFYDMVKDGDLFEMCLFLKWLSVDIEMLVNI